MDNDKQATQEQETATSQETAANEEQVTIPPELEGISKETAIEVMNTYKEQQAEGDDDAGGNDSKEQSESQSQSVERTNTDEPDAEADSDNKPVEHAVPYARFKQVNDTMKAYKAELEAIKASQVQQQTTPPYPQTQEQQQTFQQPQAQQLTPPQPPAYSDWRVTPEVAKEIDKIAKKDAMELAGMTQEDVDALEYADDDDTQKQQYDTAYRMAKDRVINALRQTMETQHNQQIAAQQAAARQTAESMAYMGEFVRNEQQDEHYNDILSYGENEFFTAQDQTVKDAIVAATVRLNNQQPTQQDVALIKQYYLAAKTAYNQKQTQAAKSIKEMTKHPKSEQIEGTADTGNAMTVEKLEHMLKTDSWDKIPQAAKEALKRGYI